MRTDRLALCTALVLAMSSGTSATHAATSALHGQWVGNSQIDGRRATARTMLTLADADSEGTTLRIEDVNTCTLRRGKYSAESEGKWSLSFSEANGGAACKRLAAGTFALRSGENQQELYLEAAYRDGDGAAAVRRAALHRYP